LKQSDVGRLRHLYVKKIERHRGIGCTLVMRLLAERNVSTILRQSSFEFKLGTLALSAVD
jgi:hypothetical protein